MKSWTLLIVLLVVGLAGCQGIYDLWPCKIQKNSVEYVGRDPNQVGWPSIDKAKDLKKEAILTHDERQMKFDYEVKLDKYKYTKAVEFLESGIVEASKDRDFVIGTLENPGLGLYALMGLAGFGAWFKGYQTQRPQDYSEEEFQAELKKRQIVV